ncbi:MAG TPA: hypothetical protein VN554_00925 [Verrucomicrobiae bacterium]|nr:hypothetical protein [Verrucomicrobiae bacterium]
MRGKEVLALVSIGAAVAGSVEASVQFNTMASARRDGIEIAACGSRFDVPAAVLEQQGPQMIPIDFETLADWQQPTETEEPQEAVETTQSAPPTPDRYVVSGQTVECLDHQGVDTSEVYVGEPEVLLMAFAKLQQSRGEHFDASSTLTGGVAGAAVGGLIAFAIALSQELEGKEKDSREDDDAAPAPEADEENQEGGIYDYERDPDFAA